MKKQVLYTAIVLAALMLSSCAAGLYSASSDFADDDLYETLDTEALQQQRDKEAARRRAPIDQYVSQTVARTKGEKLSAEGNGYQSILADDFETAHERRLKGVESPEYRMPSSYQNAETSRAFTYASAYDPAQYNIIISGSNVWVEPKYITAMFGNWGGNVYYGQYYPPRYNIGFSYSYSIYDPFYGWGAGFYPHPWYGWYNPYWGWGGCYPGWGYDPGFYYPSLHHPWYGYGWGYGYYRPRNHRYDSYRHGNNSYKGNHHYYPNYGQGYRHHRDYNRGGTYNRGGSYNRGSYYDRRGRYHNDGSVGNNRYNGNNSNRNDRYTRPSNNNRNQGYTRPSNNTTINRSGSYNTGNYGSGNSRNSYNRGR